LQYFIFDLEYKGKFKNLEPDLEKTESSAVSWASAFYIGLYS